jgi:endonuclease/exonuclease/phosphatase family metal-dependent hydrolase
MAHDDLTAARLKRLERPATASEVRRRGIDLEAVQCADLGHRWEQTELVRQRDGVLRGLPARFCVCSACRTERIDILTWSGRVVSRQYVHDPAYIDNFRALDPDDQYARRSEYRRLMLSVLPGRRVSHA